MSYKIITISRQCGSGGHTIGQALAEKLNIPLYDKKILEEVARRSGFAEDVIESEGEYSTPSMIFNIAMGGYNAWDASKRETMPLREQINAYQTEYIREMADKGGCVIVGRCADYILRERTDCLNVFIYGNREERVKRVIDEHRVPEHEAEAHVKKRDKMRAAHYKYITDQEWGDMKNYDLCLDSSELGIDKCIELIMNCVQ